MAEPDSPAQQEEQPLPREQETQSPEPEEVSPEPRRSTASPQARSRPKATARRTSAAEVTGDAQAVTAEVSSAEEQPRYLYEPRSGMPYQVTSAAERTRLLMRGYSANPPFDPSEKGVEEVLAYMAGHPQEAASIRSRERAGKGRVTILGDG